MKKLLIFTIFATLSFSTAAAKEPAKETSAQSTPLYSEKIMLWDKKVPGKFQPYLKIYPVKNAKNKSAGMVLICPGGGYRRRSHHEGEPVALKFNQFGWHAAVVEYRTAPNVFPAPQQDALRAIRIIRSNAEKWGVNKDQIAIMGFSAGGHLAASSGTIWKDINADAGDAIDKEDCAPNAMILCYPVIYLTNGHLGSGRYLLGAKNPPADKMAKLDLHKRITADTPPAFLWHTATDKVVDVDNSIAFAREMWKKQRTAELHIYPRGGHGQCLGTRNKRFPELRSWPSLANKFLRTIKFNPAK